MEENGTTLAITTVPVADMAAVFAQKNAEIAALKAAAQPVTVITPKPAPATPADFQAEIDRLRAENENLRSAKTTGGKLSLKVSEKGALSVYGMGRFPVTLYREQMSRLLGMKDEILKFIEENSGKLAVKGE